MSLVDIVVWPFARLLEILYNWTDSYGLAIILFALVVNLILLPFMAKSKKGMMKTTRIQPQLKELEKKHKGNQQKYQQEVMKLYKEQGASPTSGCLWSLLPFPILLALYGVIRQPLGYMMGLSDKSVKELTEWATQNAGFVASKQGTYDQIGVTNAIHQNWDSVINALGDFGGKLLDIDYSFLGMNLGMVPKWKIWSFDFSSADIGAQIGLFFIPIIAAFLSWASMKISQATNPPQAGAQAQVSMKTMNLMMPIMSIWICFIMPAALGVYWIANSCFGIVRDVVLTKHYKRKLDIEDAERIAAQKAKEEEMARRREETEQLRAEGATTRNSNTSKKKMQAQQKQIDDERRAATERAEREARRAQLGIETPENPSQVGKRRYARGRAYDPNRYADEMKESAAPAEEEPEQSQENTET
jgi:YidC/Oxa1 family membrane protein insertase